MSKINEKYSFRDLSRRWGDFSKVPADEINNTEIHGSGFGRGIPWDTGVFPKDMTGVTFVLCNLDNCVVPPGNIVHESCTNKHHQVMNDGENWIVDKDLKPIEPLHKDRFEKYGLSTDPKDISLIKVFEPITITKQKELGGVL